MAMRYRGHWSFSSFFAGDDRELRIQLPRYDLGTQYNWVYRVTRNISVVSYSRSPENYIWLSFYFLDLIRAQLNERPEELRTEDLHRQIASS